MPKSTPHAKTPSGQSANVQSARSAGLVYVTDRAPGIQRRRRGRGFCYIDQYGHVIRRKTELDRIARLLATLRPRHLPLLWNAVVRWGGRA